jgi:hypothetical protein
MKFTLTHYEKDDTMRRQLLWIAIVALVAVGSKANAQTVSYATGYPKTGDGAKQFVVKGSVTIPMGWTLKNVNVEIWKGATKDAEVKVYELKFLANGQFPSVFGGLWGEAVISAPEANTTYDIVVTVFLKDGQGKDRVYRTKGTTVKSGQ